MQVKSATAQLTTQIQKHGGGHINAGELIEKFADKLVAGDYQQVLAMTMRRQLLALTGVVDDSSAADKSALLIIAEHDVDDPLQNIETLNLR